jgi:hypothetical protein
MKLFSIEEANAVLPLLRQCLERMAEARRTIHRLSPEIRRAQEHADVGGGSEIGAVYIEQVIRLQREAQKIQSVGVLVKDYDLGLCDFPHDHNGQVVYLCWRLDEEQIGWWHEVDAGFAGRQPLERLRS